MLRPLMMSSLALLVVVPATLAIFDPPPPDPEDPHRPTDRPLDPRVDPAKVGERTRAPLPEPLVLPLPATHVIASRAADVPISNAHWTSAIRAIERGTGFLLRTQEPSGGWMVEAMATPTGSEGGSEGGDDGDDDEPSPVAVSITALALKAMVQADPEAMTSASVMRAMRFIDASRIEDGSWSGGALTNYVTATVVSALAGSDEFRFRDEIDGGVAWLQRSQWDQTEGLGPQKDWFGGAGYGGRGRPDLSNTQLMLDALYDAGVSPDSPAFQRAVTFISRAQNLRATNDAEWARDDGGFVYTPAGDGESLASEVAGEGRRGEKPPAGEARSLRSYGSMTYAAFKSLLYAGLSPDDVRVRAAFEWIRGHWTFQENPGLGQQGLFYYYHTMSRALRVAQQNHVTDMDGGRHNWREELIDAIVSRQQSDGSWRNETDRWLEGHEPLCTTYAVLALEEALKPVTRLTPDTNE
jgi:squalene-hopene/tetraprenyl-beta-curcumene cyclase